MRRNRNTLNPVQHILIFLVRLYRWTLSPAMTFLFGPLSQCRFTPSCSQYAAEAIRTHGGLAGSWLAAHRLCRCHPWGKSGFDPVPRVTAGGRSPNACGMHRQGLAAPFVGTATDSVSGYHR